MTAPETTRLSDYERIDYTLRPAKCVERKMICEACQRLVHLHPLSSYQYVGFGSVYFHDFTLFHRQLGLKDMVSIEEDVPNEARFRFNMPYKCVDLLMGRSTEQLEENVSWAQPTILWLDYTCRLNKEVLTDTSLFCTNAQPGSLIIVTVNAHPDEADSQHTMAPEAARGPRLDRLGKLRRRVGGQGHLSYIY